MDAPKESEGGETTQLAQHVDHGHGHGDGGTCSKVKAVMQEYNLPLIMGVVFAMLAANLAYAPYHAFWHTQWGHIYIFGPSHPRPFHARFSSQFPGTCFGVSSKIGAP